MTGKVITLGHSPDPELVAVLAELLEDAKAGTLCALSGVAEYHSGHVDHITSGQVDEYTTAGHLQAVAIWLLQDDE